MTSHVFSRGLARLSRHTSPAQFADYSVKTSKPRPVLGLIIVTAAMLGAPLTAHSQAPQVEGEILVGFTPVAPTIGSSAAAAARAEAVSAVETRLNGVATPLRDLDVVRVRLRPGTGVAAAVAAARRVPGVSFAEPNYVLRAYSNPNDSYYRNQWAPSRVQADLAWSLWKGNATTILAIVDTGVNTTHPDLANKILRDGAGNVVGYDYANGDSDPTDDNGHGTHCAGIAAAQSNNGAGIAGIAGWNGDSGASDTGSTKILAVKVLGADGSGSLSAVANGITYAADKGAKVISLSLGGSASTVTLSNAVAYAWSKGAIVVAAAGNDGKSTMSYPGALPNVISVAATDSTDTLASFSNYGSWVTCAAPGVNILSTYQDSYAYMSGTSMATPLVAGEVALLASYAPALTNTQLRAAVLGNTDPVVSYSGRTIGGGRVNVYRALQAVNGGGTSPTPTPPAAPTSLSATALSRSEIRLFWTDRASDETNFVVERSTGGAFSVVATLGANTTGYTNTGLSANTAYSFRVRASNSAGNSAYSNTASARTPRR